ncbi:uncharacterized protein LOC108451143 [Gossypium arboreum]|uniref:uncharacterized protein LOC108451143 n=1 Tax=Gossypium arboreum TaxID=29729 RepID=UPI0008194AC0|nr:uncharacterized protein LOC108451143 [Gossypium arboreum]
MTTFEDLYTRKCKTPLYWSELSASKMVGVDLIQETEDKVRIIWDSLKAASNHQKLDTDLKRKDIEFAGGDRVFLKVSSWKKVLRSDPSQVIPHNEIELQSDLTYLEELVRILAHEVKELRNKRVPLVKVLWHRHGSEEAT